jgi:hypothetical protein
VGNLKNVKPKKDWRPPFFGSFFGRAKNEQRKFQDKESDTPLESKKKQEYFKTKKVT